MGRAIILLFLGAMAGCAFGPVQPPSKPLAPSFPSNALVTQRGILKARGREFPLNGYVTTSETGGLRLVLANDFGGVLVEALVDANGKTSVVSAKAPFRKTWVEHYVMEDLKCVFGIGSSTNCQARRVGTNHFLIERRWYQLDLRTVQIKSGGAP